MEGVNVICLKYGTRYSEFYVNRLYLSVSKYLKRKHKFYCCTDDSRGLIDGIIPIHFPENPGLKKWPHVLVKLMLMQRNFGGISGPTLFLDIDLIVTGALDCFFDYQPGSFCMIHNWCNWRKRILGLRPRVGNSSVVRFDSGEKSERIFQIFRKEMYRAEDKSIFNTEQAFMTYAASDLNWWPDEWVQSYKWNLRPTFPMNFLRKPRLPSNCRILVFHGRPNPEEAISDYRGTRIHHFTKAAPWIEKYWNDDEHDLDHEET